MRKLDRGEFHLELEGAPVLPTSATPQSPRGPRAPRGTVGNRCRGITDVCHVLGV